MSEELYKEAINLITEENFCSAMFICRRLKIKFKEALEIVNRMEKEKIIGELIIGKPRIIKTKK